MRSVAIAGVGLIGGSFGLALRKAGFDGEIVGISSPATIDAAIKLKAISRGVTLDEAIASADVIYLAQPIEVILQTLRTIGARARAGCLITDAGSTKYCIVEHAAQFLTPGTFVGGHPMAGKEKRGIEHADPDLFVGRPYVVTPTLPQPPQLDEFRHWLRRIGAQVVETDPKQHDATVALTSHLPQLLSTTLAALLDESPQPLVDTIFGPGLADMTRLALSSEEIWASILETNKTEIQSALGAFIENLQEVQKELRGAAVSRRFRSGRDFARKIRASD